VDIHLLSIAEPQPAGVWAGEAPRRADRCRSDERLVVFLTLESTAPIPADAVQQLTERLATLYYQTGGPATSALRTAAEKLNQYLLQRNLQQSGQGQHVVGHLILLAIRRDRLVAGISGSGHLFLSSRRRSEHFHDPDVAGRGLGIARAMRMRFFQAEVQPDDVMLLAPYPPTTWHGVMRQPGRNLLAIRHQLREAAPSEVQALLLQLQAGKGRVIWETAREEKPFRDQQAAKRIREPETPRVTDAPQTPEVPERERVERIEMGATAEAPEISMQRAEAEEMIETSPRLRWQERLGPPLLAAGNAVQRTLAALGRAFGALLLRALPGDVARLPSAVMAGMAIAVPLMVVTIAAVVYFDRGRAQQYQVYFNEAQALALQAPALGDPALERTAWKATLQKLDQAETYRRTPESQALRQQAQAALDEMNHATRLNFAPVIVGGLPADAHPTRLVVTSEDLFVLDSSRGVVWHYTRSGALKYTRDANFVCGPGNYAGLIVSPLVDIAPLPMGNEAGAALIAVDSEGNLVYCGGSRGAMARPLAPPPVPLGTVAAIEFRQGDLYVLDTVGNGVYRYPGTKGMFDSLPVLVFDEQVPDMRQAIDLTITPEDLFLLYADGHMVACTFGKTGSQPTLCQEPAHFQDTRVGVSSDVLLDDTHLTQLLYAPPPDPSLYLLDAQNAAVMHFSLRLAFQEQFQPAEALDGEITAFTIGPEGLIFIATSQQVYAAARP